MRTLLVCNRPERLSSLIKCLREEGHEIKAASSEMALAAIGRSLPDLVIIATWDLASLPNFFLEVQRLYQLTGYHPVIVAITNQEGVDIDCLYNIGFDLVSEVPLRETQVVAQIMALDRRLGLSARTLVSPHLLCDLHSRSVFIKNSNGTLFTSLAAIGQIQFILLKCFLRHPRRIWSRVELLDQLKIESDCHKEVETIDIRLVDGNVYRLRKLVKDALFHVPMTKTIDTGYKDAFFHTERSGGYFFLDAIKFQGEINELHVLRQTLGVA